MLAKRIIACLDISEGRVVKGVKFTQHRDAGDAVELAKKYARDGVDELVFYDITASADNRGIMLDLVRHIAAEIFIPFTVGGGIRTIEDIRAVLLAGADKVSLNSAALANPDLINQSAEIFGSQCIVVGVDVRAENGGHVVYTHTGRDETRKAAGRDALQWISEAQDRGAGEITANVMDADGTKAGYDIEFLRSANQQLTIPLVASGGAGSVQDFVDLFHRDAADAALAASVFHFGELTVAQVKEKLAAEKIAVRR